MGPETKTFFFITKHNPMFHQIIMLKEKGLRARPIYLGFPKEKGRLTIGTPRPFDRTCRHVLLLGSNDLQAGESRHNPKRFCFAFGFAGARFAANWNGDF
jgi:hypothetical protein